MSEKLKCKGCQGRDRIIESLAKEIERLSKLTKQPKQEVKKVA